MGDREVKIEIPLQRILGETVDAPSQSGGRKIDFEQPAVPVEIGLWWAEIQHVDTIDFGALGYAPPSSPVDAIAVGHAEGWTSVSGPTRALDLALSRALHGVGEDVHLRGEDRVITPLVRRGVLSGSLGKVFLLPDDRVPGRVVAVGGTGMPGELRQGELSMLAAELCWTIGRLGKRHLAMPLIGAGSMKPGAVATAWLRGIRVALATLEPAARWHLRRVTFVAHTGADMTAVHDAITRFVETEKKRAPYKPKLDVTYCAPGADALRTGRDSAQRFARPSRPQPAGEPTPTRIGVEWSGKRLRIGAMTNTAAVPQREMPIDPALIDEANRRLTAIADPTEQIFWARYVGSLLLREELVRATLAPGAPPVVLVLDPESARIRWEMLADPGAVHTTDELQNVFLGIEPGITRQLSTTSAPPPERPPPPRRLLRVLVVADPADDLPGARDEGRAVAELFESFNRLWAHDGYQVDVTLLSGSAQATRNDVLYRLTSRGPYDILHYAGHCTCDEQDPQGSGWVFERGAVMSIHEINRVDRIPRFIFSNACSSGVIGPADAPLALAPTFASAFFARGVANFVCTAWKVDDALARAFALHVYGALLGLAVTPTEQGTYTFARDTENGPQPMYRAMSEARRRLALGLGDRRTWGAYHHYGDPYLRLFDRARLLGHDKR